MLWKLYLYCETQFKKTLTSGVFCTLFVWFYMFHDGLCWTWIWAVCTQLCKYRRVDKLVSQSPQDVVIIHTQTPIAWGWIWSLQKCSFIIFLMVDHLSISFAWCLFFIMLPPPLCWPPLIWLMTLLSSQFHRENRKRAHREYFFVCVKKTFCQMMPHVNLLYVYLKSAVYSLYLNKSAEFNHSDQ